MKEQDVAQAVECPPVKVSIILSILHSGPFAVLIGCTGGGFRGATLKLEMPRRQTLNANWAKKALPSHLKVSSEAYPECSQTVPNSGSQLAHQRLWYALSCLLESVYIKYLLLLKRKGSSLCDDSRFPVKKYAQNDQTFDIQ